MVGSRRVEFKVALYEKAIIERLNSPIDNEFVRLGLLLSVRQFMKDKIKEVGKLPKYDDMLVSELLSAAISENKLVRNNARILIRNQPTDSLKKSFDNAFANQTDRQKNSS